MRSKGTDLTESCIVAEADEAEVFWATAGTGDAHVIYLAADSRRSLMKQLLTLGELSVVVLSTKLVEKLGADIVREVKLLTSAQVILAGKFSDTVVESRARAAGAFCYLVLPDNISYLSEAIHAARHEHDRLAG